MSTTDDVLGELANLHAIGEEPEEPKPEPPAPPDPEPTSNRAVDALTDGLDRMIGVLGGVAKNIADLRAIVVELRTALIGPLDEEPSEEPEAAPQVEAAPREAPKPARRAVKAPLPPEPPEVSRQLPPAPPVRRTLTPIQRQIAERRAKAYSAAAPGSLPTLTAPDPEVVMEDAPSSQVSDEDKADVAALTGMRRPAPATPEEAADEAKVAAQRRLAEVSPDSDFSDWSLDDESRPRGRGQGATNGPDVSTA